MTRQQDAVHRTLGPGGLVLIGEGEPGRLKALLAGEVRKHERVAYGVKVTTIVMGNKEGQVPLDKLADHIKKLPKTLQANQVTDIRQRLRALDAVRPQLPMPKGPMPTNPRQVKGARQAMRGRSRPRLRGASGTRRARFPVASDRERSAGPVWTDERADTLLSPVTVERAKAQDGSDSGAAAQQRARQDEPLGWSMTHGQRGQRRARECAATAPGSCWTR